MLKVYRINEEYCVLNGYYTLAERTASEIVDEINRGEWPQDFDLSDIIYETIDKDLIYYDDQWKVLMEYCTPQDCNYNQAIEMYVDDIYNYIEEVELKIEYRTDERGQIEVYEDNIVIYTDEYFDQQYDTDDYTDLSQEEYEEMIVEQFTMYLNDEAGREVMKIIIEAVNE